MSELRFHCSAVTGGAAAGAAAAAGWSQGDSGVGRGCLVVSCDSGLGPMLTGTLLCFFVAFIASPYGRAKRSRDGTGVVRSATLIRTRFEVSVPASFRKTDPRLPCRANASAK